MTENAALSNTSGGMEKSPENDSSTPLDAQAIQAIRKKIKSVSALLIGIPYCEDKINHKCGKWTDLSKMPENLDCSGLVAGVYHHEGLKISDGSQNQFNFTIAIPKEKAQPGDLVFEMREKDINKIYHVGMVYDDKYIIEARDYQPGSSFQTGKVILRERSHWEQFSYTRPDGIFESFAGYRAHPKLI